MRLLLIAFGGALGTLARYGASQLARKYVDAWPLGTLLVNVVGCFVLALVTELVLRGLKLDENVRLAVTVGFCGGLTTYSSLNQETLTLIRDGATLTGLLYLMATIAMCAAASVLALVTARVLTP